MEDIWRELPYELTSMILEQRCISGILDILAREGYSFIPELLKKNNAHISGSAIISAMLNTDYNDIDIYVKYTYPYDRTIYYDTNNFLEHKNQTIQKCLNRIPRVVEHPSFKILDKYEAIKLPDAKLAIHGYLIGTADSEILKTIGASYNPVLNLYNVDSNIDGYYVQFIEEDIYEELRKVDNSSKLVVTRSGNDYVWIDTPLGKILYTRDFGFPNSKKLNVVITSGNQIPDFVRINFDSGICAATYDGNRLDDYFHYISRKIINMQIEFHVESKWISCIVDKYRKMLGRFHTNHRKLRFVKTCERISKYHSRGFLITIKKLMI